MDRSTGVSFNRRKGVYLIRSSGVCFGGIYNYEKKVWEIETLGAFQIFEISDLLKFSASKSIYKIANPNIDGKQVDGIEIVRELRNIAMHGKNPISKKFDTSLYSLDSLMKLSKSLILLLEETSSISKMIRANPDLLKSIELNNRSKLEIIYNHHPKALEFFLGF